MLVMIKTILHERTRPVHECELWERFGRIPVCKCMSTKMHFIIIIIIIIIITKFIIKSSTRVLIWLEVLSATKHDPYLPLLHSRSLVGIHCAYHRRKINFPAVAVEPGYGHPTQY